MAFYFAWTDPGTAFAPGHHVAAEDVFSFHLSQAEGEFAGLDVVMRNPSVSLLSVSRQQWCWFSWDDGATVHPLFHGRLIGVPQDMASDLVKVSFIARPSDFDDQKSTLAATLRVAPYWDAMWIDQTARLDPEVVLESRTARWHIDRATHELTISDIIVGEDGTIDVADEHFYDAFRVSYSQPPATTVHVEAVAEFSQVNLGSIDIASMIPNIKTMTPEGLLKSWPSPGAQIGSSWVVDEVAVRFRGQTLNAKAINNTAESTANATLASLLQAIRAVTSDDPETFIENADDTVWSDFETLFGSKDEALLLFGDVFPGKGPNGRWSSFGSFTSTGFATRYRYGDPTYSILATGDGGEVNIYGETITTTKFIVKYNASRRYQERALFDLVGDVQPLAIDLDSSNVISVEARAAADVAPTDGETPPITDLSQRRYFQTERGQQSLQYLLCVARAKLLATCRAVTIAASLPFDYAPAITLRKNMLLSDPRLPAGVAGGKIISYRLALDGQSGALTCDVLIGATVGNDSVIETASDGTPAYVEDGYVDDGYVVRSGQIHPITDDLGYGDIGDVPIADDGLDFSALSPADIVIAVDVTLPFAEQKTLIDALDGRYLNWTGVAQEMNALFTEVELRMREVDGLQFETDVAVSPTVLRVPKTIDLGATS